MGGLSARIAGLACAFAIVLFAAPAAAAAPAYAHDPFIAREGAYYYLFSTGQGIPVRRSRDLRAWEMLPPVFPTRPEWLVKGLVGFAGDFWAPEVSWHDGLWRLYYCASSFGSNRSRIGVATSPTLDPEGPGFGWVDHGEVIASEPGRDDWNAIDPSLSVDAAGRWFLSFGSFWSGVKQVELDPRAGKPPIPRPPLRSLASRPDVPNDPIEAPFISSHGGFWYLWVSFDYCCRALQSSYKVAVGRSREITGPFRGENGRDMREGGGTVVLEGYDDVHGPGHCSVLQDSGQDLLVHHMYDGRRGGVAVLQVRPIRWVDDWPRVGAPLP